MNKLSKLMIQQTQKTIISDKITDVNRSLEETVVRRMDFVSSKIDYLGYRRYVPTVGEQHVEAIKEYNIKLKNKNSQVPPSIDLDENPIMAFDFFYLVNPETVSVDNKVLQDTTVLYSWLQSKLTEARPSMWMDDLIRHHSVIKELDMEDETLIHKMTLFIPIAVNNAYYTIRGNNYFPVWFKVNKCVESKRNNGKTNSVKTSIKVHHDDASYSSLHPGVAGGLECVVWDKYKEERNPFSAIPDYRIPDLNKEFANKIVFTDEGATPIDLDYTVIANTYNLHLLDPEDYVDPLDAVSNTSLDLIAGMKFYVDRNTPTQFKIHSGLDGYLSKKIHDYLRKIEKSSRTTKLSNLKDRGSLNSHYIATTIVKNSHYMLSNSVNSRNAHLLSQYTTLRGGSDGKKYIKRSNRQFKNEMVGIASFDFMTQSSNVGSGGSLAYGIDDKYIVER